MTGDAAGAPHRRRSRRHTTGPAADGGSQQAPPHSHPLPDPRSKEQPQPAKPKAEVQPPAFVKGQRVLYRQRDGSMVEAQVRWRTGERTAVQGQAWLACPACCGGSAHAAAGSQPRACGGGVSAACMRRRGLSHVPAAGLRLLRSLPGMPAAATQPPALASPCPAHAQVAAVDMSVLPPSYGIELPDGHYRETEAGRLQPLPEPQDAVA